MPALVAVCVLYLTGCAFSKTTDKLESAYESIEGGDYDGALAFLTAALDDGEDERLIKRAQGIAYLGQGEYTKAIEAFEECLSLSSGIVSGIDYDVNYYLASAYCKNNNVDEAIKIYDAVLNMKPEEVDALYLRGILYARKGDLDSAIDNFNKAINLRPEDYDMLIQIYSILENNGYKEIGLSYLQAAMENGTKKMSNYEKGQISFYLEDYESARTYFEKAKDERGSDAVIFLGKTYEIIGDINYAISVYSGYITSGNESPEVLNQMGLCKMGLGDYDGALTAFRQALKIEDNKIVKELKFNEIAACEYVGSYTEACSLLESYMREYPDDEKAKREYKFLKTR